MINNFCKVSFFMGQCVIVIVIEVVVVVTVVVVVGI